MEKIKVVHHLRNLGLGGTEKTCQLFVDYLNTNMFEVYLAYEHDGPRGALFRRMPHVKMYKITRHAKPESSFETIQSVVDRVGADILHVYRSGYAEFPEPGVDVNVPHFVETNVFGQVDQNPQVERSLFMSKWLLDNTLQRTAPISRGLASRGTWDYINNPVESPASSDLLDAAIRWKNEGAIILGRCGRPDNGIYNDINVRAARSLRMQGHDVRFIVVAPPSNMLDDMAEWDIPFHVIEPTVEPLALSAFYNSIDIYAHARADGETFGVNIAEAMMHAKPVVTHVAEPSFVGMGVFQSQTTLVDDGKTGFVCSNDVGLYTEALLRLIEDPDLQLTMGNAGYKKAFEEYHAAACTRKLENVYREIMLCKS